MSKNEPSEPKIGEGHLGAMGRQGLRELRAAIYPASNIAQQPEYGLYGTRTPGEIADDRRIVDRDFDEEPDRESIEDYRHQHEGDRDDRDIDLER